MKQIILLIFIFSLSACTGIDTKLVVPIQVKAIPSVWNVSGRLGAHVQETQHNAGFDISFNQKNYELLLTGTLGLGQIMIKSDAQTLLVNDKPINSTLKHWMNEELGWYFPVQKIPSIVFSRQTKIDTDWQIEVMSYQQLNQTNYPRVVRFSHTSKPIKIKLVLSNINS